MCYRKPGPRCSNTARRRLNAAENEFALRSRHLELALSSGDPAKITAAEHAERAAFKKRLLASAEFDLTTDGIKQRRAAGESERADFQQRMREELISAVHAQPADEHDPDDGDEHERCPDCGQFVAAHSQCTCTPTSSPDAVDQIRSTVDQSVFTAEYDDTKSKVAAIHEQLEHAVSTLTTSERWQAYLDTQARFHQYSYNNALLIMLQRPTATQCASFTTWKSLDRSVNKGEHGIFIQRPMLKTITLYDKQGKPVVDEQGKIVKAKRLIGFTGAYTFDISQTSGKELPQISNRLTGEAPSGFRDELETVINSEGYTVHYADASTDPYLGTEGINGYTNSDRKTVVIRSSMSDAQQVKTLAHELAHIKLGHTSDDFDYGRCRPQAEVEAESTSYILTTANGMDAGDYTFGYVASWANGDPTRIKSTADKVQRTARDLLSGHSWTNASIAPSDRPEAKAAAATYQARSHRSRTSSTRRKTA